MSKSKLKKKVERVFGSILSIALLLGTRPSASSAAETASEVMGSETGW